MSHGFNSKELTKIPFAIQKKKKERGREQNKIDDEKNLLKYTIKRMYMANKGSLASKHNIMISNYTFFHNFTTAIIVVKLR